MLHKIQRASYISGLHASLTEPSRIGLALNCVTIDTTGVVVANTSNIDRLLVKGLMIILHYCGARGGLWAPDRSGPQAPVSKLSRCLPVGVAIFAVEQWRILFSFNPLLTKACVVMADCSDKDR